MLRATGELGLDLSRSVVVGDQWSDVALAGAVSVPALLVETGYGAGQLVAPRDGLVADAVVANLMEAASWIVRELPRPGGHAA